jgi:signal transduction histidine kinase
VFASFAKNYDQRRLRRLLLVMFVTLALPTTAVIWQAFDQLKWESWYRYRNDAEALVQRIDFAVEQRVVAAQNRSFDDFAFATDDTVSGRRSPLAAFPPHEDVPGVLGYFQIDPRGLFSSPLVPAESIDPATLRMDESEWQQRQASAANVHRILAENALARASAGKEVRRQEEPEAEEIEEIVVTSSASFPADAEDEALASVAPASGAFEAAPQAAGDRDAQQPALEQRAFDQLNQPVANAAATGRFADSAEPESGGRAGALGKVQELNLDDQLERKNEQLKRQSADESAESVSEADIAPARERRAVASPAAPAEADLRSDLPAAITTFESDIEPYQFNLLGSGHGVLYRNAWRDGARYIQGALIEQPVFTHNVIEAALNATSLGGMSDLIIVYDDDIIDVLRDGRDYGLPGSASSLQGSLLYRARLSPPFEGLELIFSVRELPPGPGAAVLGWTTLVIAIVFVAGFFALYRLGVGQIRLARQQQDFVSAVTHELKTPLTSIRMYGEMLREGWADEEKQRQYHEYIHDESERLTRLISNVLQLASITRDEPQIDRQQVTTDELLDLVRSKIEHQVERAGFQLTISQDDRTTGRHLSIDADCFTQIVINLVDNGIKFSRDADKRRIEVQASMGADDTVLFSVRDYGPGIPKDQLKKIFRMFYRTESELTRETVGTGIGLAIVHQLTTAMDGAVDVVNRDPGVEFRLAFPAVRATPSNHP